MAKQSGAASMLADKTFGQSCGWANSLAAEKVRLKQLNNKLVLFRNVKVDNFMTISNQTAQRAVRACNAAHDQMHTKGNGSYDVAPRQAWDLVHYIWRISDTKHTCAQ